MQRDKPAVPRDAILQRPVIYSVGPHSLSIALINEGRWSVSIDGAPTSRTYATQVEAWEAGVRAVDEQERARKS